MGKRWSKLQSRLYNLMDEKAEFQIHCALYEMNSNDGYHGIVAVFYNDRQGCGVRLSETV